jgi:hypothetical protein
MNSAAPSGGSTLAAFAKEEANKKAKGATGESSPAEGTSPCRPSLSGGLHHDDAAFLEANKVSIAPRESADDVKQAVRSSSSEEAKFRTMSFPQKVSIDLELQ